MKKTKEQTKKCQCIYRKDGTILGLCLRCAKMEMEAHSKGYGHAFKDLTKHLEGKKPTNRFNDWKKKVKHLIEKNEQKGMREVMDDYTSTLKPKKNIKNKTKKEKQPMHDCPAFGKEILTPKAFNSKTNKFCYKCPFCGYQENIK